MDNLDRAEMDSADAPILFSARAPILTHSYYTCEREREYNMMCMCFEPRSALRHQFRHTPRHKVMCVRFCMDAELFAWENIASSAASRGHTQLIAEDVKLKLLLTPRKKLTLLTTL